jgi:hypothetical protein
MLTLSVAHARATIDLNIFDVFNFMLNSGISIQNDQIQYMIKSKNKKERDEVSTMGSALISREIRRMIHLCDTVFWALRNRLRNLDFETREGNLENEIMASPINNC